MMPFIHYYIVTNFTTYHFDNGSLFIESREVGLARELVIKVNTIRKPIFFVIRVG